MLPSMDIGMQIIHFKKFSVPVSTGTSKVDKLLKCPQTQSHAEGVIFQNFLGRHAPRPPCAGMLRMPVCFAHHECKYLTNPTSTMMTGQVVPPLFKSLDPPLHKYYRYYLCLYFNRINKLLLQRRLPGQDIVMAIVTFDHDLSSAIHTESNRLVEGVLYE